MAQTTAIEWFWIHLPENISKEYFDLFEQAKAMEKEQIINAHGKKINGGFRTNGDFFQEEITGEQYYNETFRK